MAKCMCGFLLDSKHPRVAASVFLIDDFCISPIQGLECSFAQDRQFNKIYQVKVKSQKNIWKP